LRRLVLASSLVSLAVVTALTAAATTAGAAVPGVTPQAAKTALERAERALNAPETLSTAPAAGSRDATAALRDLAVALPALRGADRAAARDLLARPTDKRDRDYFGKEAADSPTCDADFCVHWTDKAANRPAKNVFDQILPANCRTVYSTPLAVREALVTADLVFAADELRRREDLKLMRKGSVIVDVAVDQGGCIETVHATTHAEPTYVIDGVIHYGVANMPGAVPRTSTFALTNATLSWTVKLAELGPIGAVEKSAPLRSAANLIGGKITYQAVAEAFSLPFTPPLEAVRAIR